MIETVRNSAARRTFALATALAVVMSLGALGLVSGSPSSGGGEPIYYFVGHGRAHGVGMCMDGVYYRAKEGQDYRTILNFYYTGIAFSGMDDNRPVRVLGRDGQVRVLSMHDYLHHLQEEPDNYPIEELKALYVAARTYTLSCINRNKHAAQGYDICSSGDCCQAFDENKTIGNYPNNNAAVDATTGQIMTYNGSPITAAYCGSCGGHSENNEDVWGGTPIPYLRGKPDTYCSNSPRYEWRYSFTKSDVEARLNSRGDTAVGGLLAMDLNYSRTPGGRVKTARLVGTAAVKLVPGSTIEGLFGFANTLFDIVQPNFDEYLLVLNPNGEDAVVTFTFMKPDGSTLDQVQEVPAKSRYTLKLNDLMQFQEASTRIVSDRPVIAERAMYFNYANRFNGGTASMGVKQPKTKWYLAEGYTGGNFETYVLVQNPNAEAVEVKFTFMLPGGRPPVVKAVQMPALSRMTIKADDVPGVEATDVSTQVECTSGAGIIAERSMYFDYYGCDGGHNAMGVPEPSGTWYLAEGYTGGKFETYVLLQNPGASPATVDLTFMKEGGTVVRKAYTVPAQGRYTVHVDTLPGMENCGFSTMIVARNTAQVIAERAMYFDYNNAGLDDGTDEVGVTAPAEDWYFAEGYTGNGFDTYVLVQNPQSAPADVHVTFNTPSGQTVSKEYNVKAHSRYTIHVDEVQGLSDAEVATTIHSENGVQVVAERAMYFVYSNGYAQRDGGHAAAGTNQPSTTWYFAEGYTGY